MIAKSMSRMVLLLLALVAAGSLAIVFAVQHTHRESPVEIEALTAAPAASKPGSGARDQGTPATAQA